MRAKDTTMLNNKNLPALDSQFENALLPPQHNDFGKDNCPAPPVSSMSVILDSALYIEKHHTKTVAVVPENKAEETDGQDAFAALDIENLFPDDFGSGVGASRQFKLPALAANDEAIELLFPDLDVHDKNDSLQSQQVTRGKHLADMNENEVALGFQLTSPEVGPIRNQGPHRKTPTSDHLGNRQAESHLHKANNNNAHPAQMNMGKSLTLSSTPLTQEALNGTDGSQKRPRADVFKLPKIPHRRIRETHNSAMHSMAPLRTNSVDTPITAALPASFGSPDIATFSNLLQPPSPPELIESIMLPDSEETSLDILLGIHSDNRNKRASANAGRRQQRRSRKSSTGVQPSSFPPSPHSPLHGAVSLLRDYRRAGAQVPKQNANFMSALPDKFLNGQIPKEVGLVLQRQQPSDYSQPLHSPSSQIPETSNYFGTAGCAVGNNSPGHLYNLGHSPSTTGRAPPHPNETLRPVAKRKRPKMINDRACKFPKRHAGADAGVNQGGHENLLSVSCLPMRVTHNHLPPRRDDSEVEPALDGEENHKMQKKKRTRVEDLDPSEVHVCSFDDCRKKFAKKYNLKIHERRHRGDLPFICPQCAKKFMWQSSFERHLKVHESRADGSSRRTRNGKRSQDAELLERRSIYELVRTSDEMSQLKLNGIKITVNHKESASLALAMSLCTLNCIPPAELHSAFSVGDSEVITGNEDDEKPTDDGNMKDDDFTQEGQALDGVAQGDDVEMFEDA